MHCPAETRPCSQELWASDGATRCGRCRRHRAGTLPWWRERAAAKRCADAAAATARWLGAARERCALVRDGVGYTAAIERARAEREEKRAAALAAHERAGVAELAQLLRAHRVAARALSPQVRAAAQLARACRSAREHAQRVLAREAAREAARLAAAAAPPR